MIDHALRATGIGGSELGAILGLDSRRDAFGVWADKLGLIEREPPNARMRVGKRFEKVVVEWYAEETGRTKPGEVAWSDKTLVHPERPWQIGSPDAFVWEDGHHAGGVDAKVVALDQARKWGENGSDIVPDSIMLQMIWYCSLTDLPWFDVAALIGGNDLRIYRIHRSADLEEDLLAEAESFWVNHVLAKVPPAPGPRSAEALKKMFPRNVEALRDATDQEAALLERLRHARDKFDEVETEHDAIENQVKLAIGDGDGLQYAGGKVTWRKDKDSVGTSWQAIFDAVREHVNWSLIGHQVFDGTPQSWTRDTVIRELEKRNQVVTRVGPRKLRCTFNEKG